MSDDFPDDMPEELKVILEQMREQGIDVQSVRAMPLGGALDPDKDPVEQANTMAHDLSQAFGAMAQSAEAPLVVVRLAALELYLRAAMHEVICDNCRMNDGDNRDAKLQRLQELAASYWDNNFDHVKAEYEMYKSSTHHGAGHS